MAAGRPQPQAEWIMLQVGVVSVFVAAAAIYAAPSLIAVLRGHRRWALVIVLNILLGWTLVGWLLALAIALQIAPRRPAWMKRIQRPRARGKAVAQVAPEASGARGDPNDPPQIREDVYAAWLDQGAGLEAGGQH